MKGKVKGASSKSRTRSLSDVLPWSIFLVILFVVICILGYRNRESILGSSSGLEGLELLAKIAGGLLAIIGAIILNKRAVAQDKSNKLTEDGHRQERFRDAIGHLGDDSPAIQLGGIYALYHLAWDDPNRCESILDILCAYVRDTTNSQKYLKSNKSKPSEQVQTILKLLFRKEEPNKGILGADYRADLSGAHLQGANFFKAQLQGAMLFKAHLQGAYLMDTQLQGAYLTDTQLQDANFNNAHLQGAMLTVAHLQGASLFKAHLQGASLFKAHLQGAILSGAQLQGAILSGAQLQGASLFKAHLQGCLAIDRRYTSEVFPERIKSRIDKKTELSTAIFSGGFTEGQLAQVMEDTECLGEEWQDSFKKKMTEHLGKKASHSLPDAHEATIGKYTKEEAERWIADYGKVRHSSFS